MKKILLAVIVVSFLSPLASGGFSDVYTTDTHYAAITSLVDQGILVGYEDGTFRPSQEVNRAEALKIILMGTGTAVDESSTAGLLFSDSDEEDWFFGYVSTGVSLGIIQGYDDGTFKPEQTVNRAEAVKMLLVATGNETSPSASAEWYAPYEAYAKTWNIEPVQSDGLWHAEEVITRGNISEMVYRLQQTESQGHSFDEAQNWLRKEFPTVDISMKVPFGWGYKQEGVGAVFLLDRENDQLSLLTPYENGGTLLMTRYANAEGESAGALFDGIGKGTQGTVNGYKALIVNHEGESTYKEWYIYLENKSLLHILAMRGEGAYSSYLEWYFEAMVASVEYESAGTSELTIEETVEALREAIQVDGVGAEMMEFLSDWELIETDAIGVGTGPVDYFYSPSANITIKYERSFDVILDLKEGETSAF